MAAVGVVALQGGVAEHCSVLRVLGHRVMELRDPEFLPEVRAVFLPGGESTTLVMLLKRWNLFEPLKERISQGLPVLGTCAGAVLLSRKITEREHEIRQDSLGASEVLAERNRFGRQVSSFEEELTIQGLETPFPGVFIRAPLLTPLDSRVQVLASVREGAVFLRQDNVWLCSFHPELTGDPRVHALFLEESGIAGA